MFDRNYGDLIKIENLLIVWQGFLRGKRRKEDVVDFQIKLAENLTSLWRDLKSGEYEHGKYTAFNVFDPKPRDIHKASVRDRVVHHLICEEIYPYFDARFIYDSYSCRKQKGVHRALDRFDYFAAKISKNNTKTCWILKCDIKKFFASIDHEILIDIIGRQIIDKELIQLIEKIIFSFSSGRAGKGLPLGNVTSQLFANICLNELDYFAKQKLRAKYYIRYADDFVILSDCKKYLNDLLPPIAEFLRVNLELELCWRKVFVKTWVAGIDFLGWIHFPNHRQIRTTTKRRIIKRMRGYYDPRAANSYRGLLSHGRTYKLQKRLFGAFWSVENLDT